MRMGNKKPRNKISVTATSRFSPQSLTFGADLPSTLFLFTTDCKHCRQATLQIAFLYSWNNSVAPRV